MVVYTVVDVCTVPKITIIICKLICGPLRRRKGWAVGLYRRRGDNATERRTGAYPGGVP